MRAVRFLLPLLILLICVSVAYVTVANRKTPERRTTPVSVLEVEVLPIQRQSYRVKVETRGTVRPRTESTLIPEIAGRIVRLSPHARAGEFFESSDVLMEIDPRDYRSEVIVAEAELAQARTQLSEETARSAQAERDWKRLGGLAKPDALVLRKPQLAAARADVESAKARLDQARLRLERTRITAPYDGRVLEQNVDVGQYVSPGTVLARVYAIDYVEVRLPLSNQQLEFVDVPEVYRGESTAQLRAGPRVTLKARVGQRVHTWEGRVVRAEGSIDVRSRQLFVVAQVDDPYGKGPEGRPPLKVGQFVEAEIEGRTLEGIIVIPRGALRAGDEVMIVDQGNRLRTRAAEVLWTDADNAVIRSGLVAGELLVVTALGTGLTGVEVRPRAAVSEQATTAEPQTDSNQAGRKAADTGAAPI